ncbi:hypothetical protein NAP1_13963 [Erythrobacter sp. NAP1]|uniref:hypothetical protein n=1 Tax=Erythrobacter sp. NAP1 TaxID=237727 RepID=UPI0000687626|nr:hypothetical protein [Erythrobacter sp. NAP1]EAQ28710.1 hypothetical protein NAP1_13963 [Erythrobacter sp. NAP1]
MIDYFALALGHGLLALALLRLVLREETDVDPRLRELDEKAEAAREEGSAASRNARRRAQMKDGSGPK